MWTGTARVVTRSCRTCSRPANSSSTASTCGSSRRPPRLPSGSASRRVRRATRRSSHSTSWTTRAGCATTMCPRSAAVCRSARPFGYLGSRFCGWCTRWWGPSCRRSSWVRRRRSRLRRGSFCGIICPSKWMDHLFFFFFWWVSHPRFCRVTPWLLMRWYLACFFFY